MPDDRIIPNQVVHLILCLFERDRLVQALWPNAMDTMSPVSDPLLRAHECFIEGEAVLIDHADLDQLGLGTARSNSDHFTVDSETVKKCRQIGSSQAQLRLGILTDR